MSKEELKKLKEKVEELQEELEELTDEELEQVIGGVGGNMQDDVGFNGTLLVINPQD